MRDQERVQATRDALPRIVRLQADLLRSRLVDGQNTLLHGCMEVEFCKANFMNILKTQGEIAAPKTK